MCVDHIRLDSTLVSAAMIGDGQTSKTKYRPLEEKQRTATSYDQKVCFLTIYVPFFTLCWSKDTVSIQYEEACGRTVVDSAVV